MAVTSTQKAFVDIIGTSYTVSGDDVVMACPFCGEQRKKFGVSPKGLWNCFICEKHGYGLTSFISKYYHISKAEAKQEIKTQHLETTSDLVASLNDDSTDLFSALLQTKPQATKQQLTMPRIPSSVKLLATNLTNPEAQPYLKYLAKRKISLAQIKYYNISYCVDGHLELPSGKDLNLRTSIVFYAYDMQGQPYYWNTRSIEANPYIKSINAPAVVGEYSRATSIWNLVSLNYSKDVILSEGCFNALMNDYQGYASIATYGKKVTEQQVDKLLACNPRTITLFLDNDAVQEKLDLAERLLSRGFDLNNLFIVNSPYKGDANDIGRSKSYQLVKQAKPYNKSNAVTSKLKMFLS